jgi:hypothetical protein
MMKETETRTRLPAYLAHGAPRTAHRNETVAEASLGEIVY